MKPIIFVFCCFVAFVLSVQPDDDLIKNLPGQPKGNFSWRQYSGYRTVDSTTQSQLFYWFIESQRDPLHDDVVIWFNGGPGCSSLGGFFTENGAWRPHKNGVDLAINDYSWNQIANVLFIESPIGVGFSHTNDPNQYRTGDDKTANDVYTFLQAWLKDFKQYQTSKFWLSGESYAGHYVPEFAQRVLDGNENEEGIPVNLQGFLVGNAWTSMPIDNYGAVTFWWTHAIISDETYSGIVANCNFSDVGPLSVGDSCDNFVNRAQSEMGNINIYDIYVNVCTQNFNVVEQLALAGSPVHKFMAKSVKQHWPPYHPCTETFLATYLNRPEVQKAIHANITYKWNQCSGLVRYNYSDVQKSVIPLYQNFLVQNKLKMLVYSGDVDAIVPITGTRDWLRSLNLTIVKAWRPWTLENQVGGYIVEYENGLTFTSVRNAGHMVPSTQPARALFMLNTFISGKPFPPSK